MSCSSRTGPIVTATMILVQHPKFESLHAHSFKSLYKTFCVNVSEMLRERKKTTQKDLQLNLQKYKHVAETIVLFIQKPGVPPREMAGKPQGRCASMCVDA